MKSNIKSKILILLTLGILFALLPIIININLNFNAGNSDKISEYSDNISEYDEYLKASKLSAPIHIDDGNPSINWSVAKDAGICTGDGTYSEPYVIEDLVINGGGSESCIWIENSVVYFKIENCTVYNSGDSPNAGIRLSYVNNSQLINNTCSSNYIGIFLYNNDNNEIVGNTLNDNGFGGIYLEDSDYNTISENSASNNSIGITLWGSDNVVSGNNISNNYYGISLFDSVNSEIAGNTVNDNDDYGIQLAFSDNNTISGNTVNNNGNNGTQLAFSDYNTISGNTVNNNDDVGIRLAFSDYNTISGNTLLGNAECIVEEWCEGNVFDNNDCLIVIEGDGIPIELIIIISSISGGAVLGVATLLLIRRKRKRIE